MKTPYGKQCRFYYENFHRGHDDQECRLIRANSNSPRWETKDCQNCPVPDILLANSNPDMVLEAEIKKGFMRMGRKVEVKAFCTRHLCDIPQPITGCPQCAAERPSLEELFGGG